MSKMVIVTIMTLVSALGWTDEKVVETVSANTTPAKVPSTRKEAWIEDASVSTNDVPR